MTTKEYLSQAYRLDDEINTKLESLERLKSIAEKMTSVNSGMPHGSSDPHSKEDVLIKIADMDAEITADIDRLVDLKREITRKINSVDDQTQRIVLYKRYINHERWEQIACDTNYDMRQVTRIHGRALQSVGKKMEEIDNAIQSVLKCP